MNTPTHSEIVSKAAPSLYNGTVNPKRDYTTTPFTFTVIYQDADNDPPSYVRVWLNGLEYDMSKANPSDNDYTDGCEYSLTLYLSKGTYDYFFRASDGSTTVRDPPDYSAYSDLAVLNSGPSLYSGSVSPSSGYATTTFTYTVTYKDVDNDPPEYVKVQIDGVSWYMSKANPSDNDYTDGCVYTYSTTLNKGSHTYEFKASDGDIHAYLPDDYGYYNGPTVYNSGPVLSSGGVSPSSGSSTTTFTYTVTYTDADNDAPSYIRVYIDGNYYGMSKQDPGDSDYTDGCIYTYSTTLGGGGHTYYFEASDGTDSARLPSGGSYSGPTVGNSVPVLSSGGVSPSSGNFITTFTFTVTYLDADNDPPTYVRVSIDGVYYEMVKQNSGDNDYTNGCVYVYSTKLGLGSHSFYFVASDGADSVRLPSTGWFSGPNVFDDVPPELTITVPASDTTVSTGVIWINGTYNGTGSEIAQISCNDSRFSLRVNPPYGTVGVFTFSNNTPISTGSFYVRITVTDSANLLANMVRRVIVDQSLPSVSVVTPFSDTTINAGPVIIRGYYDGTGSEIQQITCNDSRFTLQTASPFGLTGTYVFVNNTPIPTSSFVVKVTVKDSVGLEKFTVRNVIVNNTGVVGSGSWSAPPGNNLYTYVAGVELYMNTTAPVSVFLTNTTTNLGGDPPAGFEFLGGFLSILVNDTDAVQGITVIIHYTDESVANVGVDENSLRIGYWNETSSQWTILPTTVDTDNNTVKAHTDHLTVFICMGPTYIPSVPLRPLPTSTLLLLLISQIAGPNTLSYAAIGLLAILILAVIVTIGVRGRRRQRTYTTKGEVASPRTRVPSREQIRPQTLTQEEERVSEPRAEQQARCPFCGNIVNPGEKTCSKCGAVLL